MSTVTDDTIHIFRVWRDDQSTLGVLTAQGLDGPLYTLELPWRDNALRVSCVPEGTFHYSKWDSPHFGREVIRLDDGDVMPRSAILCHVANRPSELLGCIAPGLRHKKWGNEVWGVASSGDPLDAIMAAVPDMGTICIEGIW